MPGLGHQTSPPTDSKALNTGAALDYWTPYHVVLTMTCFFAVMDQHTSLQLPGSQGTVHEASGQQMQTWHPQNPQLLSNLSPPGAQ